MRSLQMIRKLSTSLFQNRVVQDLLRSGKSIIQPAPYLYDANGIPLLRQSHFIKESPSIDGVVLDEAPGQGTARPMQPGRCKDFDGSDDSIVGPPSNTFDHTSITVFVRFNADVIAAGDLSQRIVNLFRGVATSTIIISVGGNDKLQFFKSPSSGGPITTEVTISTGVWYSAAIVIEGTAATMYVDGLETNAGSMAATLNPFTADTVTVGSGRSLLVFDGKVSDLQIYNAALTPEQILLIHKGVPQSGLELHYKLDEQHPTLAYDSSGNGRHGSLLNVNATVGNFFYEGADVPFSWQNDVGYSDLFIDDKNVYVPRRETTGGQIPITADNTTLTADNSNLTADLTEAVI